MTTPGVARAPVYAGVDVVGLRRIEQQLEDVFLHLTDHTEEPSDG